MGKGKEECITAPMKSGRMLSCLGRVVLEVKEKTKEHVKRQPTLFAEVPTRRRILRIAIRKEKKALMLKALEINRNTAPCNCRKGKRKMCREAGNGAQDTSS
jgi:hypothetical protein